MTSSEIAVNATSTLIFDINTIDNNGETVSIIMTSNRAMDGLESQMIDYFLLNFGLKLTI